MLYEHLATKELGGTLDVLTVAHANALVAAQRQLVAVLVGGPADADAARIGPLDIDR